MLTPQITTNIRTQGQFKAQPFTGRRDQPEINEDQIANKAADLATQKILTQPALMQTMVQQVAAKASQFVADTILGKIADTSTFKEKVINNLAATLSPTQAADVSEKAQKLDHLTAVKTHMGIALNICRKSMNSELLQEKGYNAIDALIKVAAGTTSPSDSDNIEPLIDFANLCDREYKGSYFCSGGSGKQEAQKIVKELKATIAQEMENLGFSEEIVAPLKTPPSLV